ncbi:MAG TPA: Zn-ribbon domain-containing OB-fold protein [Anaerolineales bacterium]|nr:Zn-ribbon domain-containing OB-fold protein [Anaerolineales bacterium]
MATTAERLFTPASFEKYLNERKLMGSHCIACNRDYLPPRAICPHCHDDQLTWVEFAGNAKLLAFTSIFIAPTAMIEAGYGREHPYLAGIVELDEGVKISAQILGLDASKPQEVKIGTPLQAEFVVRSEGEKKRTLLAFRAV